MRTTVVTGGASGLGAATADALRERGDRVIVVDRRDADVVADLSTPDGRAEAVDGILGLVDGRLDGIATWAGLGGGDAATLVVNYAGTVEVVEGLHEVLAAAPSPRVVVTSSRMSVEVPDPTLVDAMLAGEVERVAREHPQEILRQSYYISSKVAVARWMRRAAVSPQWGGRGIAVNAIAPGLIETPMTRGALDDPEIRPWLLAAHPQAEDVLSQPREIGALARFLLSDDAGLLMGQCLFADRGTEAILRGSSTW